MWRSSRRQFLATTAAGLMGCATRPLLSPAPGFPAEAWSLGPREQALIRAERADFDLVVRGPAGAVLRRRARPVPPRLELARVAQRMERTMRGAGGVGIAGPQVGLSLRIATLMLDYKSKHPRVVFVRNPVIVERSDSNIEGYEGCLSVPGVGGLVRRSAWIRVQHTSAEGEVLTRTAEGYNAVLWQHELDHLDGVLYLDRLLGPTLPSDEVRRRRRELERRRSGPASSPTTRLWPAPGRDDGDWRDGRPFGALAL